MKCNGMLRTIVLPIVRLLIHKASLTNSLQWNVFAIIQFGGNFHSADIYLQVISRHFLNM